MRMSWAHLILVVIEQAVYCMKCTIAGHFLFSVHFRRILINIFSEPDAGLASHRRNTLALMG